MILARLPSRHFRARPTPATLLVLHAMGEFIRRADGTADYAPYFLEDEGLSAHALVTPTGVVIEAVPPDKQASHALGHNRHTVGIEFLVPGVHDYASFLLAISSTDWVTQSALAAGIAWARSTGLTDVTTHEALDPARKKDPGPRFPLNDFTDGVKG